MSKEEALSADYLRARILPAANSPQPAATQDRLLAENNALLVELVHEAKRTNDLLARLDERDRKRTLRWDGLAPRIEQMAVQLTAIAVQLGRLVERNP